MTFAVSIPNLINLLFIAAGIGICSLNLLQLSSAAHLQKEIKRYFQVFFSLLIAYITAHLARQLMDGLPGGGIRTALNVVTVIEVASAGILAYEMSLLVLSGAKLE